MSTNQTDNPMASALGALPEKTLTGLADRTNQWIAGAALVAVIAIVVLGMLNASQSITLIALAIIILSALGLVFFFGTKRFASEAQKVESQVDRLQKHLIWSRRLVRMPLNEQTQKQIKEGLKHVHQAACTRLAPMNIPGFKTERVRVNIFLPNIEYAKFGEILGLSIPEGFHINMKHKPEFDLRFRPNEGLSGLVFVGQAIGSARKRSSKWERVFLEDCPEALQGKEGAFRLTKWQEALIHPELMWILSYPLLVADGDRKTALGVLNIDGISFPISESQLKLLNEAVQDEVEEIAQKFRSAPSERVSIILEDLDPRATGGQ